MTKPVFAAFAIYLLYPFLALADINADDHPTIRGQIVRADKKDLECDLNELKIKMVEQVQFDPLPVPQDWAKLTVEKRQAWMKKFQESDKGKAYFAKRQKQFDDRKIFDIEIEEEGKFVVFDVPQGRYGLAGRVDKEFDGKNYAVEVFAQVDVGEVDEVQLDPLPITITRLLAKGESVAGTELMDLRDESKKIKLSDFAGKFVLVNFWSAESPPAAADMKMLGKVYEQLRKSGDFEIVSVSLDSKRELSTRFVEENRIPWVQAFAGGWEAKSLEDFGIRSIPSYWFVNKAGKVEISNPAFYQLFRSGQADVQKILADSMAGKDIEKELAEMQKAALDAAKKADKSNNKSDK